MRKYNVDLFLTTHPQTPRIRNGEYSYKLICKGTERSGAGFESNTTANRLVLAGLIASMTELKYPCSITVYTDSGYLVNAGQKLKDWMAAGWTNSQKKPVKNDDLLRILEEKTRNHSMEYKYMAEVGRELQPKGQQKTPEP